MVRNFMFAFNVRVFLVFFAKAELSVLNLYNIAKVNLLSSESKSIRTTFTSLLSI